MGKGGIAPASRPSKGASSLELVIDPRPRTPCICSNYRCYCGVMPVAGTDQGWLSRALSSGGALGGFAAFVGASCCVIPILLVHFGLASGLVAKLGWFARWQPYFFRMNAGLLAVAASYAIWRGQASRSFWIWWVIGTTFLIAAFILPQYEFRLQSWVLDWSRR